MPPWVGRPRQLPRPCEPFSFPRKRSTRPFGISTVTFGYLSGAYNWTYARVSNSRLAFW